MSYYTECQYCGGEYDPYQGGCTCLADYAQCYSCKQDGGCSCHSTPFDAEGWHRKDDLITIGGRKVCNAHKECECCGARDGDVKLGWIAGADGLLCEPCQDEDHWCSSQGPLLDHMAKRVDQAAG
ncbi:MAG: hypothetical protein AB7L09_02015 [Nitrospira sp.]